jgi:predicted DNA-binding transcriptional regulator YafY
MRNQLSSPIAFSKARRGYYYSEDTDRLPFLQLSEGELISLYLAERMMHQFRGTRFEPDLRRAISKLNEMLPDGVSVRLDQIPDFLSVLPAAETDYDPTIRRTTSSSSTLYRTRRSPTRSSNSASGSGGAV